MVIGPTYVCHFLTFRSLVNVELPLVHLYSSIHYNYDVIMLEYYLLDITNTGGGVYSHFHTRDKAGSCGDKVP